MFLTSEEFVDVFNGRVIGNYADAKEDKPWGITFLFDGYLGCAVVEKDGVFYDVQDVDIETFDPEKEDLTKWKHYESIEKLVDAAADSLNGH